MKKLLCGVGLLALIFQVGLATADEGKQSSNKECPVGLVSGLTLDQEFGTGTSAISHCLERRHGVKLVVQINQYCLDNVPNGQCTRPFGLTHLANMIDDYEITHGMVPGRDYEIVAVAHTAGGPLMVKTDRGNKFEAQVRTLMARGVKFYMCQNATRALVRSGMLPAGNATGSIIDGVEYVTAGVTAVVDFQNQGYRYVQP
ncbi:MAG TPA: DsrE family protein [Acidiferrobacterales bacterium]|nr:DsrE family protein [Acidiferrobacterales bacterium]